MMLSESAVHPEFLRLTRHPHDELARGRKVPHARLGGMLREAARKDAFPSLRARHGSAAVDEMMTVLAREIDRQVPAVRR